MGSRTFGLLTFLYNFVCDNRIVWGATDVRELTIIHRKNAPERFAREALPHLRAYADSSVHEVEARLARTAEKKVASSDLEALAWLRAHDFSKGEAEGVLQMAKSEEGGAKTLWQMVQGGTALARAIPFADLGRAALGALSPAPAPTPRAQADAPPPVPGGTVALGPMINPDGHH